MFNLKLIGSSEVGGECAFEARPIADFLCVAAAAVDEQGAGIVYGIDGPDAELLLEHAVARCKHPDADVVCHSAFERNVGRKGMCIARGIVVARRHVAFAVEGADIEYLCSRTHQSGGIGDGPCSALLKGIEKYGIGCCGASGSLRRQGILQHGSRDETLGYRVGVLWRCFIVGD